MAKKKAAKPPVEEKTGEAQDIALQLLISGAEKQFGKGIITTHLTDFSGLDKFSSGVIGLDKALGGGYGRGRIIEVYGPESSGKTTLTLHAIAARQKNGEVCAFVDAEHALDPEYASNIGVDLNKLLLSQPDSGEQVLDVVEMMVRSGAVNLIVVDSVAALTPRAELEGEMGDSSVGRQALLMSKAMRKLVGITKKANCTIVFINQMRMKIGVMFGNPETTSGGNALKFYASQRLDIRRTETLKEGDVALANRVRVKVVKNKIAPPFRMVHFNIAFGTGVDWARDLLDCGVEAGYIIQSGAWYSFPDGERLAQGAKNAADNIRKDKFLAATLEAQLLGRPLPEPPPEEVEEVADEESAEEVTPDADNKSTSD